MGTEAEESSPGTFILNVASTGEAVSADLLKFANRWTSGHHYIMGVVSDSALTIATLKMISEAINKLDSDGPATTGPLIDICKGVLSDFQTLRVALERATEKVDSEEGGLTVTDSWVSVEGKRANSFDVDKVSALRVTDSTSLMWEALGGIRKAEELRTRILEAMDHLWHFGPALIFMALKKAEKAGPLSPEDSKELKRLTAGIKNNLEVLEEWKPSTMTFATEYRKLVELRSQEDTKGGPAVETRELNNRDRVCRDVDDDTISIRSFVSDASDHFRDVKEILEAWIVKRQVPPGHASRRTWLVFGLPVIREQWADAGCYVDPVRMKPEWEEELSEDRTDAAEVDRNLAIEKIRSSWPDRVEREVEYLVEDRQRATSNSRQPRNWQIVNIKPQTPVQPRLDQWWRGWWQSSREPTSWIVIFKATTVSKDSEETWVKPNRFVDPFRKYPIREIRYEQEILPRRRRQDVFVERPAEHVVDMPQPRPRVGDRAYRRETVKTYARRKPEEVEADLISIVAELTGSKTTKTPAS